MSGPSRRDRPVPRRPAPPAPDPATLDRFALYELCAQAPARDARMLRAIHRAGTPTGRAAQGSAARVLGEDFCGTAALSGAWADLGRTLSAIAVDHDRATIQRARPHPRVRLICADVLRPVAPVDIIAVLNFSIGERHDRPSLIRYLKHARRRLLRGRDGCFVCDVYGGADSFLTGRVRQTVTSPEGWRIDYDWEQRTADPFTGRVTCAMHFSVRTPARAQKRSPPVVLDDAFVYDWRLWSVPELRDALHEAGFARTEVFSRHPDAVDADGDYHMLPVEDAAELGDSFSVYVVGRVR